MSGYEKLIMQFKEKVPGGQETSQKVMLVTPERTSVLECTEASQTFRYSYKIKKSQNQKQASSPCLYSCALSYLLQC